MTNLPILSPVRITEEVLKTLEKNKEYLIIDVDGEAGYMQYDGSNKFKEFDQLLWFIEELLYIYLPLQPGRGKEEILKRHTIFFENVGNDKLTEEVYAAMDEYLSSNIHKAGKEVTDQDIIKEWNRRVGKSDDAEEDYVDAVRFKIFNEGAQFVRGSSPLHKGEGKEKIKTLEDIQDCFRGFIRGKHLSAEFDVWMEQWFEDRFPSPEDKAAPMVRKPLSEITENDENKLSDILGVISPGFFISGAAGKHSYSANILKALEAWQYLQFKGYDVPQYFPVSSEAKEEQTGRENEN